MQKTRTTETIAEYNKKLILDTLRFNGSMSRADLSRHLNMSFPAISSNVKGLLDAGYIMEIGTGNNAMGRKSTMLAFNAQRGYIVGVDLGRFRIRMMLADLLGNEVASTEITNSANLSGDGKQSIQLIHDQISSILEQTGKTKHDVLCIVIGIPGIIKDGRSFLAPFTENYLEQDMIGSLQEAFEADVLLENCVNLGVIGEQWKGSGVNYKDILYIAYGVGLGSALIVDGKLYKGANSAAGEVGFMITDPTRIDKQYNEIGSLEEALSRGKINNYLDSGKFDEEIVKLIERYKNGGNTYAKLIIDEIALHFGMALVNMCALLNPEVVIIAGGLGANLGKLFVDQWKETLSNHVPFVPDLLLSELNHRETMLGAVMIGITHIHEYTI
ncbi:MAG: ROK family transcriptional regulator [Oscillospiraceae bacterium]|nr:ROK family transcriptional regulator [Oscillospiraceae bacterium]